MGASASSDFRKKPQVFINFRGADLRGGFATNLDAALKRLGINSFIDDDLKPGEDLNLLFDKIEQSTVALAFLSSRYTESDWCLNELVKIKECVDQRNLWVIPIFYKLRTSIVHDLDGCFGLQLWNLWRKTDYINRDDRILKWDAALQLVVAKKALKYEEGSNELDLITKIIAHIQAYLDKQLKEENRKPKRRREEFLKKLKEKLGMDCNVTEFIITSLIFLSLVIYAFMLSGYVYPVSVFPF